MSFGASNVDVALQMSNKILFEEPFDDALTCAWNYLLFHYWMFFSMIIDGKDRIWIFDTLNVLKWTKKEN